MRNKFASAAKDGRPFIGGEEYIKPAFIKPVMIGGGGDIKPKM